MSDPAKVLLLYAHPESQDSVANRVLLKPARQLENVTVHDLYAHYPDFFIDIPHEQALLREHDVIVFQHPLYTYSCPALLKEWLDRVLSRGFSSGPGGNQLAGKYWRSVITTGEPESAYRYDSLNVADKAQPPGPDGDPSQQIAQHRTNAQPRGQRHGDDGGEQEQHARQQ